MKTILMLITGLVGAAARCRALRAISGIMWWRQGNSAWWRQHVPVQTITPAKVQTRKTAAKVQTQKPNSAASTYPQRHPHQIMDLSELRTGEVYAFVHTRKFDGRTFVYPRRFGGFFKRTPTEQELAAVKATDKDGRDRFTIHSDGWSPRDNFKKGVTRIWFWQGEHPASYCGPDYALGRDADVEHNELIVPLDRWDESPRVQANWGEAVHRPEKDDINRKVWVILRTPDDRRRVPGVMTQLAKGASSKVGEPVYYTKFPIANGHLGCTLFGLSQMESRQGHAPMDDEG